MRVRSRWILLAAALPLFSPAVIGSQVQMTSQEIFKEYVPSLVSLPVADKARPEKTYPQFVSGVPDLASSGPSNPSADDSVLPDAVPLVKATMRDFALAVKAKDFSVFYRKIADFWKAQITPAELARIFKSYIDREIDLTPLENLDPVFEPEPALDEKGWLIAGGFFPSRPMIVKFLFKYLKENKDWKLVGIDVQVTSSPPPLPQGQALRELVNATLLDLGLAIQARDFSDFYAHIAQLWKNQTTAEELADRFRSFMDQDIDLTVLQNLDPAVDEGPALDDNGWLTLRGHYPTRPSRVDFALSYAAERGTWKLVGIDLDVKPVE